MDDIVNEIDTTLQPVNEEQERTTIQKKALIEAMEKSLGIVTQACKLAGLSRETYYNYYNSDPAFKKSCEDCADIALDFVESHAHKQIADDVPSTTIFYLKTRGRSRGYIERVDGDFTSNGQTLGVLVLPQRNNTIQENTDVDGSVE